MLSRRSLVGGAMALAGGAYLRTDIAAARRNAASAYTPTVPRIARPPSLFGLHVRNADLGERLREAEELAGRAADVVLVFAMVGEPVDDRVPQLMAAGYEVVLCLEWWDSDRDPADPRFTLKQIASGAHDAAAARWFQSFKDLPRPVHLRVLHECNGDWYPWGVFNGVNEFDDFVPAFRHIADSAWNIAGDNVRLQWCVNRVNGKDRPESIIDLYPGDDYCNALVVNGYSRPLHDDPLSFHDIFRPYYDAIKGLNHDKPFWIGETACTEAFGDKAEWINGMFATLRRLMVVDCVTWFNQRLEVADEPVRDWNFDSSAESLDAFRRGIQVDRGVT